MRRIFAVSGLGWSDATVGCSSSSSSSTSTGSTQFSGSAFGLWLMVMYGLPFDQFGRAHQVERIGAWDRRSHQSKGRCMRSTARNPKFVRRVQNVAKIEIC